MKSSMIEEHIKSICREEIGKEFITKEFITKEFITKEHFNQLMENMIEKINFNINAKTNCRLCKKFLSNTELKMNKDMKFRLCITCKKFLIDNESDRLSELSRHIDTLFTEVYLVKEELFIMKNSKEVHDEREF